MVAAGPNDVVLTESIGRVRLVTLNRPDKLNAISRALITGLLVAMRAAADDDDVHVVVLTGAGRAFSAGADLEEMAVAAATGDEVPGEARTPENDFDRLQALLEAYPKPIVGAVHGLGVGFGFTVLGYFDFCLVAEGSRLRTPFSQLGLSPEATSSYLFPLRMGWASAARALMLGDWFSAQEVVDAGLAQTVVPDEALMTEALALAARLAACPLQSLIATKSLMLQAHLRHLSDVRALERGSLERLVGTPANREALAAFAAREQEPDQDMSIQKHAASTPEKVAVRLADDPETVMTYAELDDASARLARVLRDGGARVGDRIAILMENRCEYYVAVWATRRAGLRLVPINWHLKAEEAAYVVDDCDAVTLITSVQLLELARAIRSQSPSLRDMICVGAAEADVQPFWDLIGQAAPWPMTEEPEGNFMLYSSGTSGRPKGILRPLPSEPFGVLAPFERMLGPRYGVGADTVYLSPAPLYHGAPIGWSTAVQSLGGSVSLLASFDGENVLQVIQRDRVTHAQFVPTHFVRLLKLPEAVRHRYDVSSLRSAVHAAAPCPVEVKRAMIEWWGPIIHEYYAGSEGGGFVAIDTEAWLAHPGSVGRPDPSVGGGFSDGDQEGGVRIVDADTGRELPAGDVGLIYFVNAARFEYHKAEGKTAEFFNDRGWGTLGDIGWLDEEGYLYLSDRKSHMIISGGVNIYPQEIEAVLTMHPAVADVAVIGVPNAEFGEEVKAVVQPAGATPDGLADELISYCRDRLANFKCPRTVDFVEALPRLPNGKLLKRELRKAYWPEGRTAI